MFKQNRQFECKPFSQTFLTIFVLGCAMFLGTGVLNAATFDWTNGVDGNYDDPSKWTVTGVDVDGIPDSDDDVNINVAGTYTVQVAGSEFANSVTINAANATLHMAGGLAGASTLTVKYRKSDDDAIRISRTIVRQVMETKEAILSADATQDSQFAMSESIADFRIRAMMCAPLISSDGRALGVIQVDTMDQRSRFQQDDLEVLASVASQAAFAVENAQFHEQALQSKQLERDLQLAHRVQQGFLPDKGPDIPGYEFFNYYNPASEVGGDSYDYVPLPGNRLAVIVADVSGKGVSAALLMAKCSSEARYLLASQDSPAKAISKLAAGFGGRGWDDRFITFILQVLNFETHKVTIVNAGHMAPFLRHADGTVEEVGEEYTGVPVGVDDEFEYEQFEIDLKPGETLTSFTDGFSEAQNAKDEFYGMERLLEQHKAPISGVQELGDRVVNEVSQFVGNHKQFDDMCLLCFGRTK